MTISSPPRKRGPAAVLAPDQVHEYYSRIAAEGARDSLRLNAEERQALAECFRLINRIAARQPHKFGLSPDEESAA